MKKLVLSVLLAVIMLVSALPMVLPTFAATENVFTEADYNALYVQSGLEMAADFFRNNEYWGGEVEQPPVGPGANTAYPWDVDGDGTIEAGETIDLTVPENQYAADGANPSAAFLAAQTEWSKTHSAYLNSFVWTTGAMKFKTFIRVKTATSNAFSGSGNLPSAEVSPVIMHEGYVQMETKHNSNGGIAFDGDGAPAGSTASTAQVIMGFDPTNTAYISEKVLVMFHDMRVSFKKAAGADSYNLYTPVCGKYGYAYCVTECTVNGTKVTLGTEAVAGMYYLTKAEAEAAAKVLAGKDPVAVGSTNVYTAEDGKTYAVLKATVAVTEADRAAVSLKQDAATTFTQILSLGDAVNSDVLSIYTQTDKVYEVASNYNEAGSWAKCSYIGYNNTVGDLRMYAFRRYSRALSEDEIVMNHAADLLKWFKLDIKSYAGMSSTDRQLVANELKGFTFESDRAAVAAVLKAACDSVAYDFLLKDLPAGSTAYATAATFVVTAKEFQLSVSTVKLLPEALRTRVYEAVNGFAGIRNELTLQKVIDDKVEEILDTEYSKYKDPNEYDYKDLYVRQDDLYLAIDFFDAKATDDPIYVGVSYDSWNEEYNKYYNLNSELQKWAPGKSGSVRNWQDMGYETLEKAFEAEVKKLYGVSFKSFTDAITSARNNRVETKRENNWSTLTDKYLWKGDPKDFEALDISDKSYPHTNVRTFGDGSLVCTLNNSVMAHLQGNNDNSDVTYQVVGKLAGNWQLRGFRMNFTGNTQVSALQYAGISVTGTAEVPKFTASNMGEGITYASNARPGVTTNYSVDMTVAIDKRAGADSGQYYSYEWNGTKYVVTRVPAGTEGAYGPEVFPGLMDMSIIMNGDVKDTIKNVPYMQNVSDALGNSGANTYYAIRIYTATLTAEEVRQNHFADLAGLYDLDLSHYYRLSEEDRINLHDTMRGIELGTDKDAVVAAYEKAICDNYYYALEAESDAAVAFLDLAEEYFLDITCLLSISAATRERVYTALMTDPDVVAGATWHSLILQGKLVDLRNEIVNEHYAESIVDTLIDLRGYQYNLYGDKPGMRAVFSVNEDRIGLLAGHYPTQNVDITLGMMLLPAANAMDAITVENGEIILPDAVIESTVAYDNAFTDEIFYMDDTPVYTIEYYPEGDAVNDKVAYIGYVCIEIEGEEPVIGYARYNGNIAKGNAFSLTDFAVYAKENLGMAHKNVQVLTNAANDEGYVSLIAGRADISEYVICLTDKNVQAVDSLQALLDEYVGITLEEVNTEKLPTAEHVIYVGICDTVHEGKDLYGIEARGNNLYLFFNDAANADATIARLATLFDMAYAEGYYHIAEGASYVYHARGLAD